MFRPVIEHGDNVEKLLHQLAYEVEIHFATLEYYKRRAWAPKSQRRRYTDIVDRGLKELSRWGYTVELARSNPQHVPRVAEALRNY